MKPDVKKIIADIKATKGNRKFCNGLAGTLQDDNYASSICKYVKTVTPERIDLLIEYAEKLEAEVTDMAVQLANSESKCRELAAELSAVDKIHNEAVFITDDHYEQCPPEVQRMIRSLAVLQIPAYDAFLAEVRAQGVEMATCALDDVNQFNYANMLDDLAQKLRKGAAHHCSHCGGIDTCYEHGCTATDQMIERYSASKSAAQSDGGNLGYAMADAVKVIDGVISAFGAKLDENGLLPCPLCGGGAEFDYDDDNLNWISCSVCGISTDTVYHTDIDARDKLREVWNRRASMLQAEPVSNSDELPLDYLQGHKDGLEWAAQLAEANHPQTGDWLYDDQINLARAIRKGPDMPTVQDGNSPVIPDGWVMVPVEPTMAMLDEFDSIIDYGAEDSKDAWSRLVAAALQR